MNTGIARSNAPCRCKLKGVSKGSVLGQHLFILAKNSLPCYLLPESIFYADDTTCKGTGFKLKLKVKT